jgi:hypothetical protein
MDSCVFHPARFRLERREPHDWLLPILRAHEPEYASIPAPAQPHGNHGLIDVADALMRVNVLAANTLQS